MQVFQAAVRKLAQTLRRASPRMPAADTRLAVQQAGDTLKQLRRRDEVQSAAAGGQSMRYPAMVIGFLQACTPVVLSCECADGWRGGVQGPGQQQSRQ